MCGILGSLLNGDQAPESLRAGLDAIFHRGPDDEGVLLHENGCLGMRRLSIIDVTGGQQPLHSEDGRYALVFNGEIYNYRELAAGLRSRGHTFSSATDGEVIVHLFEELGEATVRELRGMFAFAIYDRRERRLFLARDRFGKKPLYYTRRPNGDFFFASELKALRKLALSNGHEPIIRPQSIYDYLSFGVVPQPDTIYHNVFSLEPASTMWVDLARISSKRYWDLEFEPKLETSYEEARHEVRRVLHEAVRLRLRSDVPLGVFLSGGLDSSIICYEAARELGGALQTFTVAVDDPEYDESRVAARTAAILGVHNTILPLRIRPLEGAYQVVRSYDQPYADSSAIPTLEISKLARQHVKVVLNGDGGDELFAGYRRDVAARWFGGAPTLPIEWLLRARLRSTFDRRGVAGRFARILHGLALTPSERYLAWSTDMLRDADKHLLWRGGPMRPTEVLVDQFLAPSLTPLDRQLRADIGINLVSDLLIKMDVGTSAHSLEARSPFLDHKVAEYAARLPASFKVHGSTSKRILRDSYRGRIPGEVADGKKRGFEVPLARWLNTDLKDLVWDLLGSSNAAIGQFVDLRLVQRLLGGGAFQDRNTAYLIYAFLILELWMAEMRSDLPTPGRIGVPAAAVTSTR